MRWRAHAAGGVGNNTYTFWSSDGKEEAGEQKGPLPTWDWTPREPGKYRVKVVARDELGNTADSGWSPEFRIERVAGEESLIAVMPAQNLTGMALPVKEFKGSFVDAMKSKGLRVLGEDALENFMEKHRVRYTGGLTSELGEAFLEETGVGAVLFLSMELYDDTVPPKTALVARLVSTGKKTAVLWMDSAAMAGNDAPGFLLLGLINDPRVLWGKAKDQVVNSLTAYLSGKTTREVRKAQKKFRPKSFLGTPPKPPDGKETFSVAVLPFRNDSTRRNAGEILALLFVKELSKREDIDVVEPGEVIQTLLRSRTIMEGGLSLPQADILKAALNVDLVLTGIVMEYQDYIGGWGSPTVEFSTRVFDMKTRQIVWSSSSYNQGDDGVFFFNLGKVNTAQGMASGMARSVVEGMDALMEGVAGQMAGAAPPVSR